MTRIRLRGFRDPGAVAAAIESDLVDIAYVDEVTRDAIFVIGDVGYDFDGRADFEWVKGLIEAALAERGEPGVWITRESDGA